MRHFLISTRVCQGMFNPNHKSYYHNDDLKIFSMAHSIAPSGYFESIIEGKNTHIELDRRKAYTKSTMDVFEVPVFSEFDIWKKYDYSKNDFNKMNALTLYLVKSKGRNLFFNRTYNLIYGKFLKNMLKMLKSSITKYHLTHTKLITTN